MLQTGAVPCLSTIMIKKREVRIITLLNVVFMFLTWIETAAAVLVVVPVVSHSECVMRAERLWEAAHTGLGRSPPAGVCRLTDSSALVYHTAAAAAGAGATADMRRDC